MWLRRRYALYQVPVLVVFAASTTQGNVTGSLGLGSFFSRSYLQHQPQLVTAFHVLLVVHPEELHDVGVVREGLEDVVLGFDLLVDILKKKKKEKEKEVGWCAHLVMLHARRYPERTREAEEQLWWLLQKLKHFNTFSLLIDWMQISYPASYFNIVVTERWIFSSISIQDKE